MPAATLFCRHLRGRVRLMRDRPLPRFHEDRVSILGAFSDFKKQRTLQESEVREAFFLWPMPEPVRRYSGSPTDAEGGEWLYRRLAFCA